MNEVSQNNIRLTISIVCVVVAFFMGYLYAQREISLYKEKKSQEKIYIDITTSSKNITIKNTPAQVFFRIDGEIFQSGSIDLK